MNLWLIFLTGLTTGGITCVALQGGLLASVLANQTENDTARRWSDPAMLVPVAAFLMAKLLSHFLLGAFLGWMGTGLTLSLELRLVFQGIAALYMLATAANLLELHPIFRYVVFQPPRWTSKLLRHSSGTWFSPALLGFLTVLVPCGVTQSMEILAITSGGAFQGALVLGSFVLGTWPIFAVIGLASQTALSRWRLSLTRISVALLVLLSIASMNGILTVLDAPITAKKATEALASFGQPPNWYGSADASTSQNIHISVTNTGYSPKKLQVKVGEPVTLTLDSKETYSCASSFVFPAFNIRLQLAPTDSKTVSFTPTKKGNYTFTCGMGMYSGTLEVI